MIQEFIDGRGGYCTDVPTDLMADNELLIATNCQWRAGMKKRLGISKYQVTDFSVIADAGVVGGIRAYMNGAWTTVVALDTGAVVNFYYGTGTGFTAVDNTFDWTTAKNVEMAVLDGQIVCVNGTDKPAVIYYSGGWVVTTLEAYDSRTRSTDDWFAGQFDASETVTFVDDTTDAQDDGAADYQIASATNDDGCYISCTVPFTKVIFDTAEQMAGDPVATYKYWDGSAWTTVGALVTTPVWDAAAGDRTLEFNIPLDSDGALLWKAYDGAEAGYGGDTSTPVTGIANHFVLQIQFTTAPTVAKSCKSLTVYHTQYISQMLGDEKPSTVTAHKSHIVLGMREWVAVSPLSTIKGWRDGEFAQFYGNGTIQALVDYKDQLAVVTDQTIMTMTGTSWENWTSSRPMSHIGTVAKRSAVAVSGYVYFVAHDGIYVWNGAESNKVSGHIKTDIDSWTLTDAAGIAYDGEYWVGFPTNSVVLTSDPDTLRQAKAGADIGEARVSFFKFTSYKASGWIHFRAGDDAGTLLALGNDGTDPCLSTCDSGVKDWAATAITKQMRTKYFSPLGAHWQHKWGRLRMKWKDVTAGGGAHTVTLYSDDGDANDAQTVTVDTGTGTYETYITIPYELDGRNLAIDIQHATLLGTKFLSLAFEGERRRF